MFKTLLRKLSSSFQPEACKEGELYSIPHQGQYSIFKVLKVDNKGVHVRLYANQYSKIPSKINEHELYIDSENRTGAKHTPLTFSSIKLWNPSFIKTTKVQKDELQDYYSWKYNNHYYI